MKICKYCSTRVEDSNIKCPACGAEDFYHVIEHNEINEAQKLNYKKQPTILGCFL